MMGQIYLPCCKSLVRKTQENANGQVEGDTIFTVISAFILGHLLLLKGSCRHSADVREGGQASSNISLALWSSPGIQEHLQPIHYVITGPPYCHNGKPQ